MLFYDKEEKIQVRLKVECVLLIITMKLQKNLGPKHSTYK